MKQTPDPIQPHLQRMVDAGLSGLDIMHGELKNQMLIAEQEYDELVKKEEDNDYSDAMESMDRKYAEGILDAYTFLYALTYDLSFAIADRESKNA